MTGAAAGRCDDDDLPAKLVERQTLCISRPKPNYVLHYGDDGFEEELGTWFTKSENDVLERLVKLKMKLKSATAEDFWTLATEGLAELSGAQYGFISKRILVDDEDSAVEMPPYGQEGSCLMAQAFYYNDGHGNVGNPKNMKYFVYGCPCEHMKHDKILIIPERLSEVIPNNPNAGTFLVPAEGYLALPLTEGGKCFAHFGVMWSQEGLDRRKLSYAFIEMMFHALEDVISDGFLQRGRFSKSMKAKSRPNAVIPHEAVTATQSLRPYARSLSHELRTPMQGVVGMLDVMYATVQEAIEGHSDLRVKSVLETLRENIEVVQDSSRRAVEAADNVVHAYDMNMGVPDTPVSPPSDEEDNGRRALPSRERRPDIVVTGDNIPITFKSQTGKRRRNSITEDDGLVTPKRPRHTPTPSAISARFTRNANVSQADSLETPGDRTIEVDMDTGAAPTPDQFVTPGLRHCNLRDVLQFLINDLLKVGGRPESAIAQETENGEEIEVRVRKPNGQENVKIIRWTVDPSVPETILIDEKDLAKMISCVFLNALKFTDEGSVDLRAYFKDRSRYVVITVADTGPGIPEAFLPNLFKAFSKEDDSLTRQSEGLGLGLMVARGLARKLGGDLACVRSETTGPTRGTKFEMRVPITPADIMSRPVTPFSSPSPAISSNSAMRSSLEINQPRPRAFSQPSSLVRSLPKSAPKFSRTPPVQLPPAASTLVQASTAPRLLAKKNDFDRALAEKHPLTFLVVEDNKISRKLLVNMLKKMGYRDVYEAYDGADAVRKMEENLRHILHPNTSTPGSPIEPEQNQSSQTNGRITRRSSQQPQQQPKPVDVILMDLWMPFMDGYEASERILAMDFPNNGQTKRPTILAVTADVTAGVLERVAQAGMKGFLAKPYGLKQIERLIVEYCATAATGGASSASAPASAPPP